MTMCPAGLGAFPPCFPCPRDEGALGKMFNHTPCFVKHGETCSKMFRQCSGHFLENGVLVATLLKIRLHRHPPLPTPTVPHFYYKTPKIFE